MDTMVMLTVNLRDVDKSAREVFEKEIADIGFSKVIPASEGGELVLPEGSYALTIESEDTKETMTPYYRKFVQIMRRHDLHGPYYVLAGHASAIAVGCL